MLMFLGLAAGALSTTAFIPYIRDTCLGRTQPERASWLIWSVLGSIAFVSQVSEGATTSLWLAGVQITATILIQITATILIFALSLWFGRGTCLCKSNIKILACATVGLLLWYITQSGLFAMGIIIIVNLLGGCVTAAKAYQDPGSETLSTWVMSALASICAIVSVGALEPSILAYPTYLFVLSIMIAGAVILVRYRASYIRRTQKAPPATSMPSWIN